MRREWLDYEKGLAVLRKCPLAKWWSGGYWGDKWFLAHPDYPLLKLKRAKLTAASLTRSPQTSAPGIVWLRAMPWCLRKGGPTPVLHASRGKQEGAVPPGAKGRERRIAC